MNIPAGRQSEESCYVAKLIVGCGYVGRRLAEFWSKQGDEVLVTTRSQRRAEEFQQCGWTPIVWDVTAARSQPLPDVETIVFAVGFDRSSGRRIDDVYVGGLQHAMLVAPETVRRFIYLSSTGVYGQVDGDWVDEDSPCEPNREGGQACLRAESLLRADPAVGSKSIILRLAGIYGPGRLPQAEVLRRREPLQVVADAWLNLVHVDDIVRIIDACDREVTPPTTLCVSDGVPVMRRDFYEDLADLLGLESPEFQPPAPGTSRAERGRGSKRIRNDRLKSVIDYQFLYPTWKAGLQAILRESGG